MTRDELIQALYDAGVIPPGYGGTANQFDAFHRFADMVAARERERCAKVCEDEAEVWNEPFGHALAKAVRELGDDNGRN